MYVRIDRKRKFLGTVFLRALGLKTDEEILRRFYRADSIIVDENSLYREVSESLIGTRLTKAVVNNKGETVIPKRRKVTPHVFKEIQKAKITRLPAAAEDLEGAFFVNDITDTSTGDVLAEANTELTAELIEKLIEAGVSGFDVFFPERDEVGIVISETLKKDNYQNPTGLSDRDLSQAPGRVIPRRSKPRPNSSRGCFSTRASTISREWAG